jgi:hypothetical protein
MKKGHNESFDNDDYEWYEERKGKIKRVSSEHKPKREIRNWKKVWSQHTDDYDEHDEFYGAPSRK